LAEAEALEVLVMETRKQVLGEEHPPTLTSMTNLALTYWNQGRWKEAEVLEILVMETRKQVLGEEHPDTLTWPIRNTCTGIGNGVVRQFYEDMGQQKEAWLRSLVVEPRKTSAFMLTATNHDRYSIVCLVPYIFLFSSIPTDQNIQ
jgi:hypothetical protein